jgi:putative endonuclease
MPDARVKLGDFGEQVAAGYLQRQGYTLVARKWRCALGELDLVMRDGATLVFVEVRTRRGQPGGVAEESVGAAKQARLSALAYTFLETHSLPDTTLWRIDVVAVDVERSGRVARVNHIRDAVEEA